MVPPPKTAEKIGEKSASRRSSEKKMTLSSQRRRRGRRRRVFVDKQVLECSKLNTVTVLLLTVIKKSFKHRYT